MAFDYGPFSRRQLQLINDPLHARLTVLEGAVRSGKTIASIIRWVNYVREETSPNARLLMLGVTIATLKRNVIDDLLLIVGPDDAKYKGDGAGGAILTLYGRTVYCLGAHDERAEGRVRGMTVEGHYVDEATMIPINVLRQAYLRCSKGRGRMIWTTNPDSPYHPVFLEYIGNEKLLKSGRVRRIHYTLDDNLNLSEDYKADVKASFTGLWYKRMILGLWVVADGAIYDDWSLDKYGFETKDAPESFDGIDLTIDVGTNNPFAALLVGQTKDTLWVLREYYYNGREMQKQKTNAQYVEDLRKFLGQEKDENGEWYGGVRVRHVYIDPSALSFKTEMKQAGFNVKDASNDVTEGIKTTASRMALKLIRVHRSCKNLDRELSSYTWDSKAAKKGIEQPLKEHDHTCDALRYLVFTRFGKALPAVGVHSRRVA